MYADDTTLFCDINNIQNLKITLNAELRNITDWLAANKLSLNTSKTKFMVFHSDKKIVMYPKLLINDVEIERVDCSTDVLSDHRVDDHQTPIFRPSRRCDKLRSDSSPDIRTANFHVDISDGATETLALCTGEERQETGSDNDTANPGTFNRSRTIDISTIVLGILVPSRSSTGTPKEKIRSWR